MKLHLDRPGGVLLIPFAFAGCFSAPSGIPDNAGEFLSEWVEESQTEPTDSIPDDFWGRIELPNPNRTNPFVVSATTETKSAQNVKLKGFVEVEEPKAILLVDNVLTVLAATQTAHGIKLVEIRPPEVVYEQRGIKYSLSLLSM